MASSKNLAWPPVGLMDQSINMDPIKITVELRDEDTNDLLQTIGWTLDVKPQILAMPIYAPGSDIKTVRMLSLGMLFHIITTAVALISILIHVIRRLAACMTIEVKYSMIIKKFESGSSHLELNQKTGDDLKNLLKDNNDEEKQGLLKVNNAPNDSALDSEIKRISEKNTEESQPSEISHYIEDDNGQVTRVMVKNVNKGLKDEFFISRDKNFKLTPKSKLK